LWPPTDLAATPRTNEPNRLGYDFP
jgi:hypothetical protein